MSDMQEFSASSRAEEKVNEHAFDPMAALPVHEEKKGSAEGAADNSVDNQSYFLGEVPQAFLVDPHAYLPLNSDKLTDSSVEKLLTEVQILIQEEVNQIQRLQKQISGWEARIEKNKAHITNNEARIKQNYVDIGYDKKNRDYWWGRAEQVMLDFETAASANRQNDWAWVIKKYGLKNADGTEIEARNPCVEELCNGESTNLAATYKTAGNKYEQTKQDREEENKRLIRENSNLMNGNDTLQGYISATYLNEIEPLQDGVLLLKELGVKLKELVQDDNATHGELRSWADPFLNDFIRANPRVALSIVTNFRKLTSIPLPAANS